MLFLVLKVICGFPKQKYLGEEWCSFTFSQIFSMEDSRILIIYSIFNLLRYALLVEVYEDNPASWRYAVGKDRSINVAFSNYCECSFRHYTKNQQVGISQRQLWCVTWNYPKIFSYSVPLKSLGLSILYFKCIFNPHRILQFHAFVIWKVLFYWLCKSSKTLDNICYQHKKNIWLIAPISSEKSLSIRKLSSSRWQIQVSPNSILLLFSLKWQAHFVYFWENACQISKYEYVIVCQALFQVRMMLRENGGWFRSQPKNTSTFPRDSHCTVEGNRRVFCVLLILSHSIVKSQALRGEM